jgi:DNA-binding NtrC family response regulator
MDYLTKPVDINRVLQIVQEVPGHVKIEEKQTSVCRGRNALRKDNLLQARARTNSAEESHLADA